MTQFWSRQVTVLTRSHLKARYRKSIAGLIWVIFNPLVLFGAQCIAFKVFLKIDVPNYFFFLLGNLLPWIFLITSATMCVSLFEQKSLLLRSFSIPPSALMTAQVLEILINTAIAFLVLFVVMAISLPVSWSGIPFLPLAIVPLVLGGYYLSALLATLNVFYRDIKYLVQFATSVLFFLTPVFYPISYIPEAYRWMAEWNILYILISPFRLSIYEFDFYLFLIATGKACAVTAGLAAIQALYWRRRRNEFYQRL